MNYEMNFKVKLIKGDEHLFGSEGTQLEIKEGVLKDRQNFSWSNNGKRFLNLEELNDFFNNSCYYANFELIENKDILRTWQVYKIIDESSNYENLMFKRLKDNKIYKVSEAQTKALGLYKEKNSKGAILLLTFPINEEWQQINENYAMELDLIRKQIKELKEKENKLIYDLKL